MQGKGYLKTFLILLTLVSLWQYFLNVPIKKVERAADQYAEMASAGIADQDEAYVVGRIARTRYLDSMSSEKVLTIPLISEYTYTDLKKRQLAFGLDLKGGMSVVLQVDLKDFLKTLSKNSKDAGFIQALDKASERLRSEQKDFITMFGEEYKNISGGRSLASIFNTNPVLREKINLNSSTDEVIQVLRTMANETVQLTFERLKERIDGLGVAQPNVTLDKGRDLILVELPGVDNPERARTYLQASAKLEFWDLFRITDNGIAQAFVQADKRLKAQLTRDSTLLNDEQAQDSIYQMVYDSLGNVIDSVKVADDNANPFASDGPLLSKLQLNGADGQLSYSYATFGVAKKNQIPTIDAMLQKPEVKSLFPRDLDFRWSRSPFKDYTTNEETDLYELYGIKKKRNSEKAPLEGDVIIDAYKQPDPQTGETVVSLTMNQKGAKIWNTMTTKAAQDNNREVAIVLDDKVVSAPRVNGPIPSGRTQISGNFTLQDAEDLAKFLRVGKLPANTKIIQESIVGPSLGKDNINRSMFSMGIGFLLVLLFMILYYGGAGIVAIVTLFANMFFIFGALASMGTVLTLPGIAGILLTIGMAVDANVIIFERVREELRSGKSLTSAIRDGFKYSYSAIIDANVTTILTAIVLAYFGLGPIKGFAVVLIVGVLSSLLTAVLLGRMIIDWWVAKGNNLSFWTGWSKNMFANVRIDWLSKRKIAYIISGVLILAGLTSMLTRGFDLGVDFKGGYSYQVRFDQDVDAQTVRDALTTAFGATPVVKAVDTKNTYSITTSYLIDDDADDASDRVMTKLHEGINSIVGGNLPLKDFMSASHISGTHITSSAKVGPTIADDIKNSSLYATIFALLLIFLYILFRFNRWQYSLGAVAALFHDTLITLGIFSILRGIVPWSLEIDQAFIAAILTVIGYSINDTVVVFDRIREFLGIYRTKSRKEVINMAVNSTVSRTIITSLTTLFVVSVLFLFGGSSIKGFAFALLIGIIVGTYSSVFVATPLAYDLFNDEAKSVKTKGVKAKSVSSEKVG